jgi:hypothetical protein
MFDFRKILILFISTEVVIYMTLKSNFVDLLLNGSLRRAEIRHIYLLFGQQYWSL